MRSKTRPPHIPFVWGKSPPRNGVYPDPPPAPKADDADEYAGVLLAFRERCIERGESFRLAIMAAIRSYEHEKA